MLPKRGPDECEVVVMPWVSVHDTVVGPKLRRLTKRIDCDGATALGILVYVWTWGLTNADRDGLILDADEEDVAGYLYGIGAVKKVDPMDAVKAMIETGWIDKIGEKLYIHDWGTWQEQWYKAMQKREADRNRKRKNDDPIPHISPEEETKVTEPTESQPREDTEKASTKKAKQYSKAFEMFWDVYPRQAEKSAAYAKYQARLKDGFSEEELLAAAKAYRAKCDRLQTEKEYIKQAKTFLGANTPFIDFLPKNDPAIDVTSGDERTNPFGEYDE